MMLQKLSKANSTSYAGGSTNASASSGQAVPYSISLSSSKQSQKVQQALLSNHQLLVTSSPGQGHSGSVKKFQDNQSPCQNQGTSESQLMNQVQDQLRSQFSGEMKMTRKHSFVYNLGSTKRPIVQHQQQPLQEPQIIQVNSKSNNIGLGGSNEPLLQTTPQKGFNNDPFDEYNGGQAQQQNDYYFEYCQPKQQQLSAEKYRRGKVYELQNQFYAGVKGMQNGGGGVRGLNLQDQKHSNPLYSNNQNVQRITQQQNNRPMLNAKTLFAYRDDNITTAFSDCYSASDSANGSSSQNNQNTNMDYVDWSTNFMQNPNSKCCKVTNNSNMGQRNASQASGKFSNLSGITGFDDDFLMSSNKKPNTVNSKNSSPLNTSGSSITDEVFMNALALNNLDDSDEEIMTNQKSNAKSAEKTTKVNNFVIDSSSSQQGIEPLNQVRSNLLNQFNNIAASGGLNDQKNQPALLQDFIHNQTASSSDSQSCFNQSLLMQQPQQMAQNNLADQQNELNIALSLLPQEDKEILHEIEMYVFDQSGCRMLQKKIEDEVAGQKENQQSQFIKALIVKMTYSKQLFSTMMSDQFGNYLSQKIIESSTDQQLGQLVELVLPQITLISMNVHGTRAVQSLVEVISTRLPRMHNLMEIIINKLTESIVDLTLDAHGNHVIQAFLLLFKASDTPSDGDQPGSELTQQYTQFIFDACVDNCVSIGSHKHGCCVMQRCLEKGRQSQKLQLADIIIEKLASLIEDPYGNYLVQNVLKLQRVDKNELILMAIAKDFIRLSQLKFSSNVIEKCLESKQSFSQIDKILMGTFPEDDISIIKDLGQKSSDITLRVSFIVSKLVFHQFGNYVIQKMISVIGDDSLRKEVLLKIKSVQNSLILTKHGPKVLQKLQKTYPQIFIQNQTSHTVTTMNSQSQSKSFASNNYGQNYQNQKQGQGKKHSQQYQVQQQSQNIYNLNSNYSYQGHGQSSQGSGHFQGSQGNYKKMQYSNKQASSGQKQHQHNVKYY